MTPDHSHPITDLDATFIATKPEDTYAVIQALRLSGVNFDVTVNGPKDDPKGQDHDIFWFRKEDDQEFIVVSSRRRFRETAKLCDYPTADGESVSEPISGE